MTDELLDVTLETLRSNPPEAIPIVDKYKSYYRPSAAPPLRDLNGEATVEPLLTDFMARGRPFIFHTLSRGGDGAEKQWVWDGPGNTPYELDGWEEPPQANEPMGPFVTCKWFVPSQTDLDNDETVALPADYKFNRAHTDYQACNNPALGPACGYQDNQPMCDFYEPDAISIPVHLRTTQTDGKTREFMVQTIRLDRGIRTLQGVKLHSTEENPSLHTRTGSTADLQSMIEETVEAVREQTADGETVEEIDHQAPRNSFLQGLLPK